MFRNRRRHTVRGDVHRKRTTIRRHETLLPVAPSDRYRLLPANLCAPDVFTAADKNDTRVVCSIRDDMLASNVEGIRPATASSLEATHNLNSILRQYKVKATGEIAFICFIRFSKVDDIMNNGPWLHKVK